MRDLLYLVPPDAPEPIKLKPNFKIATFDMEHHYALTCENGIADTIHYMQSI